MESRDKVSGIWRTRKNTWRATSPVCQLHDCPVHYQCGKKFNCKNDRNNISFHLLHPQIPMLPDVIWDAAFDARASPCSLASRSFCTVHLA